MPADNCTVLNDCHLTCLFVSSGMSHSVVGIMWWSSTKLVILSKCRNFLHRNLTHLIWKKPLSSIIIENKVSWTSIPRELHINHMFHTTSYTAITLIFLIFKGSILSKMDQSNAPPSATLMQSLPSNVTF